MAVGTHVTVRLRCTLQLIGWNQIRDPSSRSCWLCKDEARKVLHGRSLQYRLKRIRSEPTTPMVSRFLPPGVQWRCEDHQADEYSGLPPPMEVQILDQQILGLQETVQRLMDNQGLTHAFLPDGTMVIGKRSP